MRKSDLITQVSKDTGLPRKTVKTVVNSVISCIKGELANSGEIGIQGFGKFVTSVRAAKTMNNIQTGETFVMPTHRVVLFKTGKELRNSVRNSGLD